MRAGDFLTMCLLSYTSRGLFAHMDKPFIQSSLLLLLLLLTPVWAYAAKRSRFTRDLVLSGFAPICGAMMLQITGGLIMEHALSQFKKLASLQPVVNGVGGNLVAIQCSRMATHLHRFSPLRVLPESDPDWMVPPWHVFTSTKSAFSSARATRSGYIPDAGQSSNQTNPVFIALSTGTLQVPTRRWRGCWPACPYPVTCSS